MCTAHATLMAQNYTLGVPQLKTMYHGARKATITLSSHIPPAQKSGNVLTGSILPHRLPSNHENKKAEPGDLCSNYGSRIEPSIRKSRCVDVTRIEDARDQGRRDQGCKESLLKPAEGRGEIFLLSDAKGFKSVCFHARRQTLWNEFSSPCHVAHYSLPSRSPGKIYVAHDVRRKVEKKKRQ